MRLFFLSFLSFVILSFFCFFNTSLVSAQSEYDCIDPNDPSTCFSDPNDAVQQLIQEQNNLPENPTPQEEKEVLKVQSFKIKDLARDLNPLNISSPQDLFARAINVLMAFIGSIALILYIYSGFIWMSAGGNNDKISKAKTILVWTTLGIIVMGGSYMIVRVVLENIG